MPRLVRALRLLMMPVMVCAATAHGDAQVTFESPVPLAGSATTDDPGSTDSHPAIATNGTATWVVAWSSNDPLVTIGYDADILFARSTDGGLTFSAQAPLNADAAYDTTVDELFIADDQDDSPAVAAHGDRFIAVWHRTKLFANTIAWARSDDGGEHWTLPATLYDKGFSPTIRHDGADPAGRRRSIVGAKRPPAIPPTSIGTGQPTASPG